jgi:predicted dehydrogenase
MTLRVALVGAGMIGQHRARALARVEGARLVAVADRREDAARTLAAEHPGVRVLGDGRAVAADDTIDAVILSTPPVDHGPIGLACLEAGQHLLVEKPLAPDVATAEALVAAAERAGRCLATGFTLRQTPAARLARRLVDEGRIGELDHVRAFHGHRGGGDFGPPWITDAAVTGGGTLMDNGIHMIDLARWFLGDAAESVGYGSEHVWQKPGCEDNGFVLLRNAAGRVATVHSSWTEWRGYGYRVEIYGTHGSVRFGYSPLWLVETRGTPGESMKRRFHLFPVYQVRERLQGWQWSFEQTLVADLRDWVEAIRAGRLAPASGVDGLEAVRIAQGIARGAP